MYFRLPTRVRIEPGCSREAGAVCRSLGSRRALLVCDPALVGGHFLNGVEASLRAADVALEREAEIESNPRAGTVDVLAERARDSGTDVVVAVGGGSAIDAAKAVAMLAANEGSIEDYVGRGRYAHPPRPFVAIPTTCGTGSEVTWVSVVTQPARSAKLSIKGETMFPDHALVDPDALATLPARVVAWTAVDALTHAVEAYTCSVSNPATDALAEQAVRLVFAHLREAWVDVAGRPAAREGLARAATIAGMAFGNADVAGVHCLSETIGGRWDVAHGLANAVLLAPVLRHHLPAIEEKLASLAPAAGVALPPGSPPAERALAVIEAIEKLTTDVSIPSFRSLGIPPSELGWIAERAVENNSNGSNPRPMDAGAYRQILDSLAGA
jgi:alcohol dehydrogenase